MYSQLTFACVLVVGISANVPAADPPVAAPKRDRVAELVEKLNASIDDPIQPNGMTAKDYLAKLGKAHGIEIVLDEVAFKANGKLFVAEEKLSFQVPKGIRLHRLLDTVCFELNGGEVEGRRLGALILDGQLVITTPDESLKRQGVKPSELEEQTNWTLWRTAWVIANDEPLSAILRRIAEAYGVNVVVTSEAAKLAESRITTRILNSPLSAILQSLTDQCGLAVFVRHNIILITLPEQGKKLKQERDWFEARRELESKTWAAERTALEGYGKAAGILQLRVKLVDPTVDEKVTVDAANAPFRQVIANLTSARFNITIDPAVGKKADAEVTLKQKDVSCEAAVKQLAALAGLRAVRMDNSLFITTPEKADRLAPAPPAAKPKSKKLKTP